MSRKVIGNKKFKIECVNISKNMSKKVEKSKRYLYNKNVMNMRGMTK